jgi:hypothetical protein
LSAVWLENHRELSTVSQKRENHRVVCRKRESQGCLLSTGREKITGVVCCLSEERKSQGADCCLPEERNFFRIRVV